MIDIDVPTAAGLMNAYRVRGGQGSPPRAPIVLVHEAFGLNAHIRSIADRLAERGHDVIAPHLYYRRTREPAAYDDVPLAVEMSKELRPADIVADLESAAAVVARGAAGRVVTIGFCFGGAVAYIGAALSDKVERAVSYYPVSILDYWDRVGPPRAPLLVHFGDDDEFLGPHERAWLADLGTDPTTDVRIQVFPRAGHAFFNDARPELYNAEPARAAWAQTLDFIDRVPTAFPAHD